MQMPVRGDTNATSVLIVADVTSMQLYTNEYLDVDVYSKHGNKKSVCSQIHDK